LPAAQIQAAFDHADRLRVSEQECARMGVSVAALARLQIDGTPAEIVVRVGPGFRRQALEHRLQVPEQQRLVLVDHDGGGGVERPDQGDPPIDPGSLQAPGHPGGEVDELHALPGQDLGPVLVDRQRFSLETDGFHGVPLDASRHCDDRSGRCRKETGKT